VVVDTHGTIPIVMTTWSSTIAMFVSTMLPPDPIGEPSNPLKGSARVVGRYIVTCTQPFKRPLYYFEYKNFFNPSVHVKVFKIATKPSGEMVNDEITNLFNFTLTNYHGHENNQIYGI
jgi:hypothetical protein